MSGKKLSRPVISFVLAVVLLMSVVSTSQFRTQDSPTILDGSPFRQAEAAATELTCFVPGCDAHALMLETQENARILEFFGDLSIWDYSYKLEGDLELNKTTQVFYPVGNWLIDCTYDYVSSKLNPFDPTQPLDFHLVRQGQMSGSLPGTNDTVDGGSEFVTGSFRYTFVDGVPKGVVGGAKILMQLDPNGAAYCQASIANWGNDAQPYAVLEKHDDGTVTASSSQPFTSPNPPQDPEHTIASYSRSGEFIAFPDNGPPVANAGPDLPASPDTPIRPGDTVTLAGSGSDPDNDPITYQWGQSMGLPAVSLIGADTDTATFTAPDVDAETLFTFKLVVKDDKGASDEDTADVKVTPEGDFEIKCNDFANEIQAGKTGETNCDIKSVDGFDEKVNLKCDAPTSSKISCGLNPISVTPPSDSSVTTKLSAITDKATPSGKYDLKITGNSGSISHSITVPIKVKGNEFAITFASFIPAPYVKAPPQFLCQANDKFLMTQLYFHGDGRSFDPESDSYRIKQIANVTTGADTDGIVDGSTPRNLVGVSKAYAQDALKDGKIDASDDDSKLNDCHLLHAIATASNKDMHVDVRRINDMQTSVHMYGASKLPFDPEAFYPFNRQVAPFLKAADIDWDFTIVVDTSSDIKTYSLKGKHDGFPAYEIYINGKPIYTRSPGPGPYSLNQILSLFAPMEVSVTRAGVIP